MIKKGFYLLTLIIFTLTFVVPIEGYAKTRVKYPFPSSSQAVFIDNTIHYIHQNYSNYEEYLSYIGNGTYMIDQRGTHFSWTSQTLGHHSLASYYFYSQYINGDGIPFNTNNFSVDNTNYLDPYGYITYHRKNTQSFYVNSSYAGKHTVSMYFNSADSINYFRLKWEY
jgi:hypothetical protein